MNVRHALVAISIGILPGTDAAWGQEPASVEAGMPDAVVPATSYTEGWTWFKRTPYQAADISAWVYADDLGAAFAMDGSGKLWMSDDLGRTWKLRADLSELMFATSSDEDVLLDIEARLLEVLSEGDPIDVDFDMDESEIQAAMDEAISGAVDSGGSEVFTDLEANPGFTLRKDGTRQTRVDLSYENGVLFLAANGQTWVSVDGGISFQLALDTHAFAVRKLGRRWIALTADGVRWGEQPGRMSRLSTGLPSEPVLDGLVDRELLIVGTSQGLYASRDGAQWRKYGTMQEPVVRVAGTERQPGLVWVITPKGLRFSNDRGLTFSKPVLNAPVRDVLVPHPDRVVAVAHGRVYESADQGQIWSPLREGLRGDALEALEPVGGGGVGVLADGKAWWLLSESAPVAKRPAEWAPLNGLIEATLAREGVDSDFNAFRRRFTAAAIPSLQLYGYWFPNSRTEDWDPALGTQLTTEGMWHMQARLVWTPRRTRSLGVVESLDEVEPEATVVVMDGEPVLLTGQDDYVAGARVQRRLSENKKLLVDRVIDLYETRRELVADLDVLTDDRLTRRVVHELAIQEVEAQLDALTEGALTRWRIENQTPGSE